MISYKDRTYCLQGKECAHRSECPRYLTEEERKRAEATKATLESGRFQKACGVAGVDVTKRQASKWNRKRGAAYAYRNHGK